MAFADADTLRDRGWQDPIDESPIDIPEGWYRGDVVHTGGGIYCRIWRTREDFDEPAEEESQVYYEVAYNAEFTGASLERYEYNESDGRWQYGGEVKHRSADEMSDQACAEVAEELMANLDKLVDE